MRLDDFRELVLRLSEELPGQFLDGIAEVVVSPRTLPHPDRPGIFTLGECIPLPAADGTGSEAVQSRIVMYHGSFSALAQLTPGFDWREEVWETLTHELRHHLEWRARQPDLEELDWAVEQNFARHDGDEFDPGFFLQGEVVADGAYRVEDDVFLDRIVGAAPKAVAFVWRGREYRTGIPREATLPAFLTVAGVAEPPPGDLVLVLRRKPGLLTLLHPGRLYQGAVQVGNARARP
jgi:zinicin-like metallopeptidase